MGYAVVLPASSGPHLFWVSTWVLHQDFSPWTPGHLPRLCLASELAATLPRPGPLHVPQGLQPLEVLSACPSPTWAFAPAQPGAPTPALFPLRVSWAPGGRNVAIRTGQGCGFGRGRPAASSRTRSRVTFPRQQSPNSCLDNKPQEMLLKKIVCQEDLGKRGLPPALRDTPGHTGETPATQTPHNATREGTSIGRTPQP